MTDDVVTENAPPPDPPAAVADTAAPDPALTGTADAPADEAADQVEKGYWPDDWRTRLAGKDEKLKARLDRFASPDNVFKSWLEADQKIRSGTFKQAALPENATEKEIADFRKAHGIPDAPDGYREHIAIPAEVTLTDADKADIDDFMAFAHANNLPPSAVKVAADWYFDSRMKAENALYESAQKLTSDRRVEIRAEYGKDYKANIGLANAFISQHIGEKGGDLTGLTLVDGTKLGDHPEFIRLIVNAARASAGDDVIVAAEFEKGGKSIDEEYDALMRLSLSSDPADRRKWNSDEVQDRLLRLAGARAAKNRAA